MRLKLFAMFLFLFALLFTPSNAEAGFFKNRRAARSGGCGYSCGAYGNSYGYSHNQFNNQGNCQFGTCK